MTSDSILYSFRYTVDGENPQVIHLTGYQDQYVDLHDDRHISVLHPDESTCLQIPEMLEQIEFSDMLSDQAYKTFKWRQSFGPVQWTDPGIGRVA